MNTPAPWDLEPSLEENRLRALGGMFIAISDECTDLHDEDAGDGAWSLGCRIYQRVCRRLLRLSASGDWPWLRVQPQRNELEFSLMVGQCLLRYFRGDAENPNQMQLFRAEEMQRDFGKFIDHPDDSFNWFIVLERDESGRAVQVVVQQANSDGEIRYPWVAAHAEQRSANGSVTPIGKPPVDVPRPALTPKEDTWQNQNRK